MTAAFNWYWLFGSHFTQCSETCLRCHAVRCGVRHCKNIFLFLPLHNTSGSVAAILQYGWRRISQTVGLCKDEIFSTRTGNQTSTTTVRALENAFSGIAERGKNAERFFSESDVIVLVTLCARAGTE